MRSRVGTPSLSRETICPEALQAHTAKMKAAKVVDPAQAGGGCLRNLGSHVLDLFLQLTGEDAQVTGAQLSARALGQHVEDYASVQLRTTSGVLGTIEVGNTVPYDGSDSEFKIADLLHDKSGYTPYEGRVVTGWPITVLSRGRVVVRDGTLQAERGSGMFIPCDHPKPAVPLGRPVTEANPATNFGANLIAPAWVGRAGAGDQS